MDCTDRPCLFRLLIPLLLVALSVAPIASAQISNYKAGTEFVELPVSIAPANDTRLEVLEFFSYACRHCFQFEPLMKTWLDSLPQQAVFKRIPVVFGDRTWQLHAQTYFATRQLGILRQTHLPFYSAIHRDKRPLETLTTVSEFLATLDVRQTLFEEAFHGEKVHENLLEARAQVLVYQIYETPTLVIAGKYRIENSANGNWRNVLRVADFLIERELEHYRLAGEAR